MTDLAATFLRSELDDARSVALGLTEDCAGLRAIIAGRTVAPTAAENATHDAAGGWWRYQTENDWGDATCQDVDLIREAWTITRWWALDASGAPCAWPVVTKEVE